MAPRGAGPGAVAKVSRLFTRWKNKTRQPPAEYDVRPRQRDRRDNIAAAQAEDVQRPQRLCQGQKPQKRQGDLNQRQQERCQGLPAAVGKGQRRAQMRHKTWPQRQKASRNKQKHNDARQAAPKLAVFQLHAKSSGNFHAGHFDQPPDRACRTRKMGRVERRRTPDGEFIGLLLQGKRVKFTDQTIRARVGLLRQQLRCHQRAALVLQCRPAFGNGGGLHPILWLRTKGGQLRINRCDPTGIYVGPREKQVTPNYKFGTQPADCKQGCVVAPGQILGPLCQSFKAIAFPNRRWRLRYLLSRGIGWKSGRKQPQQDQRCQVPDHTSSNTVGTSTSDSSQSGAGSPFSRRKAGLNIFD